MINAWARDRASWFYLGMALLGLIAIAIGFSTTYISPIARRSFSAPPVVHLHGMLCFGWIALLIAQTQLVRANRTVLHRQLGMLGLPIALGILLSGIAVALWAARRDLPTLGPVATSSIIGTMTSLTIFAALVTAAIMLRRRSDWHKRLMLLATIVVLWPAFFRFRHLMPFVPQPEIWLALVLANLPIAIAAARDRLVYGKIHPAWAIFGPLVVIEFSFEVVVFDSLAWRAAGQAIFAALS